MIQIKCDKNFGLFRSNSVIFWGPGLADCLLGSVEHVNYVTTSVTCLSLFHYSYFTPILLFPLGLFPHCLNLSLYPLVLLFIICVIARGCSTPWSRRWPRGWSSWTSPNWQNSRETKYFERKK